MSNLDLIGGIPIYTSVLSPDDGGLLHEVHDVKCRTAVSNESLSELLDRPEALEIPSGSLCVPIYRFISNLIPLQ